MSLAIRRTLKLSLLLSLCLPLSALAQNALYEYTQQQTQFLPVDEAYQLTLVADGDPFPPTFVLVVTNDPELPQIKQPATPVSQYSALRASFFQGVVFKFAVVATANHASTAIFRMCR